MATQALNILIGFTGRNRVKKVICIGDSIRMGYEPTVERQLEGQAQVLAMGGTQGGHTRNILEHLDEWVLQPAPDLVHFNAGLHDLAREVGPGPENRVPLDEYRENLRRILTTMLEKTSAKVILALTTPVDLQRQQAVDYGINRIDEDVVLYNRAAREIAAELQLEINDLYQVVVDHGVGDMLGEDGVHFTEEGSAVLGRAVATAIVAGL